MSIFPHYAMQYPCVVAAKQLYAELLKHKSAPGLRLLEISGTISGFKWNGISFQRTLGVCVGVDCHSIHLYEDMSGPTYHRYLKNRASLPQLEDWQQNPPIHAKLKWISKNQIQYRGSMNINGYVYPDKRTGKAIYLVPDNNSGREYEPDGSENEPLVLVVDDLIDEMTRLIESKIPQVALSAKHGTLG